MSDPFVAEIRMFAGNFAPTGWATCDGQLLPISQNTALFSLLGTFYGGDGKSTFALPNLQGAAPVHEGQGPGLSEIFLGQMGGSQFVTLLQSEIPLHTHNVMANVVEGEAGQVFPVPSNLWGVPSDERAYVPGANGNVAMHPTAMSVAGGSLPHNNLPPYLVVNFIIAMQGVFPPRS
jgi:microcystin-dependent protein